MVVETDWLSPAFAVGQRRRHRISSPWTLLSYLWQLPIMLAAKTFPREGGSLLLDWTMDPPTLAAKMTGEGAELTLLRAASALPHHLIHSSAQRRSLCLWLPLQALDGD